MSKYTNPDTGNFMLINSFNVTGATELLRARVVSPEEFLEWQAGYTLGRIGLLFRHVQSEDLYDRDEVSPPCILVYKSRASAHLLNALKRSYELRETPTLEDWIVFHNRRIQHDAMDRIGGCHILSLSVCRESIGIYTAAAVVLYANGIPDTRDPLQRTHLQFHCPEAGIFDMKEGDHLPVEIKELT